MIEYIPFQNTEKEKVKKILIKGNRILKKWQSRAKETVCRVNLLKFRNHVIENVNSKGTCVLEFKKGSKTDHFTIPKKDVKAIKEVMDIEERVVQAFANLIFKLSIKIFPLFKGKVELEDLHLESYISIRNCIVGYSNPDIKMMTYFYVSIRRHLIRKLKSIQGTKDANTLINQYNKVEKSLNRPTTFDEVVSLMDIDEQTSKQLLQAMSFSFCSNSNDEDSNHDLFLNSGLVFNDESGCTGFVRSGTRNGNSVYRRSKDFDQNIDISEILQKIELSNTEFLALKGFLDTPSSNSQRVNSGVVMYLCDAINPNTNKKYSRMSATLAFRRALEKIASFYEESAKEQKVA